MITGRPFSNCFCEVERFSGACDKDGKFFEPILSPQSSEITATEIMQRGAERFKRTISMNTESKKPLRTPLHVRLLVHYTVGLGPFEPRNNTSDEYAAELIEAGLLRRRNLPPEANAAAVGQYEATDLGRAMLVAITGLPVPVLPAPPREPTPAERDEKYGADLLKTGMAYEWHPTEIAKAARKHMREELQLLVSQATCPNPKPEAIDRLLRAVGIRYDCV